jgi:hypothetical protein
VGFQRSRARCGLTSPGHTAISECTISTCAAFSYIHTHSMETYANFLASLNTCVKQGQLLDMCRMNRNMPTAQASQHRHIGLVEPCVVPHHPIPAVCASVKQFPVFIFLSPRLRCAQEAQTQDDVHEHASVRHSRDT